LKHFEKEVLFYF